VSVQPRRSAGGVELSYDVTSRQPLDLQLAVADDSAETQVKVAEDR
jgi:hypothetical protein